MTARDRTVLVVVAALALLAGFWFVVLSPKRKDARAVADQVATQQKRLQEAQQNATDAESARARYTSDYATVARLGKAVPVEDDVPSLVYQLESTAHDHHIDFRAIKLDSTGAPSSTPKSNVAAAVASANGTTPASTPTATAAAAAVLPPGATVGPAGFPTMPFSFDFDGGFYEMEHFLRSVDAFTTPLGKTVSVKGRLLTLDGVAIKASRRGFPRIHASITATAYLLPADEGLTAGASPSAPGTGSSPGSSSSSAPTTSATASVAIR